MRGFETQLNVCFRIPKYRHDVYDVYMMHKRVFQINKQSKAAKLENETNEFILKFIM